MKYDYDVVVIGGGAAGLTAAKTANGIGKKVALVDMKKHLGGECTWTGCIPTKTLIKSAEIMHYAHTYQDYGLQCKNKIIYDTSQVINNARFVVHEVYKTHTPEKIEQLGIDVFLDANTKFKNKHAIHINDQIITAHKFIITTGSRPLVPPIEGLDSVHYLTNETLFELDILPQSMIILGGGPIGVEMASALNRLGVQITVIEMKDKILPREDDQLVDVVMQQMEKEGVQFQLGMRAIKVSKDEQGCKVTCTGMDNQLHTFNARRLLVAVGRLANVDGFGLEEIGVESTKHAITVNEKLQTTQPNIFAAGDVVGPYLFSHMAWYQAVIAARNACLPFFLHKKVDYTNVIWVTFTAPELATMGLVEKDARKKYGDTIQVYTSSYAEIDRAHTDRTLNGFAKIICDKKGYIIGASIAGARAGEIIHELQAIKTHDIKFVNLHDVIHAYPTYSYLIWHMSKRAYVEQLEHNFVIKLAKKLFR